MTRRPRPRHGAVLRAGTPPPRDTEHALDCECVACARRLRRARSEPPPRDRGLDPGSLPEAAEQLLGVVSDREAAKLTGTTARVIAAHRKLRRIPPVRSGPKPVAGATRDQRHSYWVSPAESLEIHRAIEVAQRPLSDVARELVLRWAREQTSTPGVDSQG